MIKIHKGEMILKVPMGSFRTIYHPAGWSVVEDIPVEPSQEPSKAPGEGRGSTPPTGSETHSKDPPRPHSQNAESDENTLSNMTDNELRQYASLLGIRVKDLKTRDKLIKAIRAHQR